MLNIQTFLFFLRRLRSSLRRERRYDTEEVLRDFSYIMAGVGDLESMMTQLLQSLRRNIHTSKAAFLFIKDHKIIDVYADGYKHSAFIGLKFEDILSVHESPSSFFLFEELEEGPFRNFFRKFDVAVFLPIKIKNKEVAILILGPQIFHAGYSQQDLDVLTIFVREVGVVMQHVQAYREIKQLNEELEQRVFKHVAKLKASQRQELVRTRALMRLKDQFVFVAAHELQTPVTAIKGFLELVTETEENFPKDVKSHLAAISLASNHLSQLINDLLEIARSDSGTLKVNVKPTALVPLIELVVEELSAPSQKKHITVSFPEQPSDFFVLADSTKLREVIANLLSNAIKYNKEKGRVDISIMQYDSKIIIEFRDTGYGISKEDQGKIFKKFFRAKGKETSEVLGTGLGLFIARMLIERMGGEIMFSSVEGEGSTFAISLPSA